MSLKQFLGILFAVTLLLWIGYVSLYSDIHFISSNEEPSRPSASRKLAFLLRPSVNVQPEGKVQRLLQGINATSNETSTSSSAIVPPKNETNKTFAPDLSSSSGREEKQEMPWENMAIVYTWVNGSDPEYQKLRAKYGGKRMVGGSRDRDSDELKHSLRSLETMMPMLKGPIYIVTPGQVPNWLNLSNPRIHVINQDSLVPPEYNPVFSSFPVEFNLWRIPNLTDIFMYLNDDYMFGRVIQPDDLFCPRGHPKFFFEHHSNVVNGSEFHDNKQVFVSALMHTNGALNEAYGKVPRKFIKHAPYLFYKKACSNLWDRFGEKYIQPTLTHKFRHSRDVLFTMLHHYYVINEGHSQGMDYDIINDENSEKDMVLYKIVDNEVELEKEFNLARQNRPKFFAVNDVFDKPETAMKLKAFLSEFYPDPSSFELTTST